MKGDTLSAIAKKFPGTTLETIAQTNRITNTDLIYANTILKIPEANVANLSKTETVKAVRISKGDKEKITSTSRTTLNKPSTHEDVCRTEHGLNQLHYPDLVRNAFILAIRKQNVNASSQQGRIYTLSEGGDQYVFQISENCVFTKIVGRDEEYWNIKQSLEEVLGPPHDVTRLTVAILRQRQERRARPPPDPEQTLATTTNNKE
jgi:hypothetical protein